MSPCIAYATVEGGSMLMPQCLCFRRGDIILSTTTLGTLLIEQVGENVLGLTAPGLLGHLVYLHFDSPARMTKFLALLAPLLTLA